MRRDARSSAAIIALIDHSGSGMRLEISFTIKRPAYECRQAALKGPTQCQRGLR
jgi:hypothetical protein